MTDLLRFKLNIQLFADDPTDPPQDPPTDPTGKAPELDYDKLAEAIEKRKSRTEEGALKGILKEKGITGSEMDEALKAYKEAKQNKVKAEQERIDNIIKENNEFKKAQLMQNVTNEAKAIAKELGVRDDRFEKLIALCDRSKFADEKGVIDKEAIKKEMESQLKDVPEFKSQKNIVITKGKGADVPPAMTDDEEYRRRKYGKNKYFRG